MKIKYFFDYFLVKFNKAMDITGQAVSLASAIMGMIPSDEEETDKGKSAPSGLKYTHNKHFRDIAAHSGHSSHDQGEDPRRRRFKYAKLYA